jgi:hypothetical protein
MANTNAPFSFRLYRGTDGIGFSLEEGTVASNVSLKIGDPLSWSSGYLTRTLTTQPIAGFAMQPLTGAATARSTILFRPASDADVYVAQADGAFALATHRGNDYDLKGASGVMEVNLAGTTSGPVRIIGLAPGSTVGTYANVLVTVKKNGWTGQA